MLKYTKQNCDLNRDNMGKSCVNTIKRSRQNVAIATQVLNPSAIGGSLRGQRKLKHFGPPDDDEEEFITYQRRAAWKKMGTYGLAIIITIFILMGIILVVGYFQSKKNEKLVSASRPVKLIQPRKPSSYIYTSKTTPDPPSLEPTDGLEFSPTSQSSFLRSFTKQDVMEESVEADNKQNEELYYPSGESATREADDEYLTGYNLEDDNHHISTLDTNEKDNKGQHHGQPFIVDNPFHINDPDHDVDDDESHETMSINNEDKDESFNATTSSEKLDNDLDQDIGKKESVHNDVSDNNEDWKSKSGIVDVTETIGESLKENNTEEQELPSQGKVLSLPPSDSVFSVEIPIYEPNNANSRFNDEEDNVDVEEKRSVTDNIEDVLSQYSKNENTSTSTENKSLTIIEVTPDKIGKNDSNTKSDNDDSQDNNRRQFIDNNEPFHQAVLHTALFHLDEEKFNLKPKKPIATAIIIEDRDFDELHALDDQEGSSKAYPFRNNGKNERKVKILKNDKVMNMKATFTPPERTLKPPGESIKSKTLFDLDDDDDDDNSDEIARTTSDTKGVKESNRARGRTEHERKNETTNAWKLRIKVDTQKAKNDLKILNDVLIDGIKDHKHPEGASSNKRVNLSAQNPYHAFLPETDTFQEKPRLLSSSSFLPNFEDLLKTMLTNIQRLNTKQTSSVAKNKESSHNRISSDFGSNYATSLNRLLLPTSTLPPPQLELDSSQFRKRTFNTEHDLLDFPSSKQDASPPQAQNYFDHLLGQFPTIGAIGSPSAAGATWNFNSPLFPTASSPSSQYDINPSGTNGIPQLAPGIVPLDLASSYIQTGGLSSPQQSGYTQFGQTPSYGASNNLYNKYGDYSQFQLPGLHKPDDVGTVTTANGAPPTYNAISQGINLLSMISGTIPNSYFHDQVYHPSHTTPSTYQNNPFTFSPPQFHFDNSGSTLATTSLATPAQIGISPSYSHQYNNGADFSSPQSSSSVPFMALHPFDYRPQESSSTENPVQNIQPPFHSPLVANRPFTAKSDREKLEEFLEEDDHDQQPAASSFSKNILTTLMRPKMGSLSPTIPQQATTTAGNIVTLYSKPKTKTANMFKTSTSKTHSIPKSFAFEILPQKNIPQNHPDLSENSVFLPGPNNFSEDKVYPVFDVLGSTSKKKSSASLGKSWEIFSGHSDKVGEGQNGHIITEKDMPSRKKSRGMLRRISKKKESNPGLKSGFFI